MNWLIVFIFEVLLFATPLWKIRKYLTPIVIFGVIWSIVDTSSSLYTSEILVLGGLGLVRIFNLTRVMKSRISEHHLRNAGLRTSIILFALQLVTFLGLVVVDVMTSESVITIMLLTQLLIALGFLFTTLRNVQKLSFTMPEDFLADSDLPTVTVAIPARNETTDLSECLTSVLQSDYPKLEILVLDDCSQVKTSDIIKSFAHKGVRFLKGEDVKEGWLAKNQAYEKLYKEASGGYLLFCGVDVRFQPDTIRSMVNLLKHRRKSMMSVLPYRVAAEANATIIQPMRYWSELALPRRMFGKPAVLSTCWLIDKKSLKKLGGFGAVRSAIVPERYFARELIQTDAYSFVRSNADIKLQTVKSLQAQRSTALRVRYPELKRRVENVILLSLFQVFAFVLPTILLPLAVAGVINISPLFPLATIAALIATHIVILRASNPSNVFVSILTFPLAVLTEIAVSFVSMFKYEFGTVEWKDRNVCLPVMKVYPKLPSIS